MTNTKNGTHPVDEEDDYLIELMGLKTDFPEAALDAYGKFYIRYWDLMLAIAKNITKDDDNAQDLVSDTFNMVYNKAGTFKKGKISRPEHIQLCIQKWMTSIMQNVFYDNYLDAEFKKTLQTENPEDVFLIEKRAVRKQLSDDFEEFVEKLKEDEVRDEKIDGNRDSENIRKVNEYLGKLSDRDRDIILTYYNYHMPGKNTPSSVLDELEKRWGTTRQNIRKILEKFRKTIQDALQPQLFIRK